MRSKKKVYLSFNTWVKNLSALIKFVENSADIKDKLPTAMKQGGKTSPWKSYFVMTNSVITNIEDSDTVLEKNLRKKEKSELLRIINVDVLKNFRDLFSSIKTKYDILENSNIPNLQTVLPIYFQLKKNLMKIKKILRK